MTKHEILSTLKSDYNAFSEMGMEIFGIFAFGSFNYGLETENSDIDAKIIYIDRGAVDLGKPYERVDSNGQVMLYSLEDFLKELKTCYHVWYEILYTDLYVISPKYRLIWKEISSLRDQYVEETLWKHLQAILACFVEQMFYLSLKNDNLPHENKRFSHLMRLEDLANRLMMGERYPQVQMVSPDVKKRILRLKKYAPLSIVDCLKKSATIYERLDKKVGDFRATYNPQVKNDVFNKISQILLSIKEEGDESAI